MSWNGRCNGGRSPETVGELFERQPIRWGVRGDVHLWLELERSLAETPVPDGRWELQRLLEKEWEANVGTALTDSSTPIYVERFDPGRGMSAGQKDMATQFLPDRSALNAVAIQR